MSAVFDQEMPTMPTERMEAIEAIQYAIKSIRIPALRRVAQRRFNRDAQRCIDEMIAQMCVSDDNEIREMVDHMGAVGIDPEKVGKWVEFFVKYILPILISSL